MSELKIKTVEDSKTEVSHLLFSKHMNSAGRLFGGQLLMWIDENDVIVIIGYVTHVGRSSMEIRIDTYVERPDGSRHPVNRAFFVMVALDANNKPVEVPRLKIQTIDEQAKWDAAEKRIELRKQRRDEGF